MNTPSKNRALDIESALLERDGSCRDINFSENISRSAARAALGYVSTLWSMTQATSAEGEDVAASEIEGFFDRPSASLSTIWNNGHNPSHIQIYFYWSVPDHVFCELTFFPQDLDPDEFSLPAFLQFVAELVRAAESTEYYVRVEDASWRHGLSSKQASVIFSHETTPLPTLP